MATSNYLLCDDEPAFRMTRIRSAQARILDPFSIKAARIQTVRVSWAEVVAGIHLPDIFTAVYSTSLVQLGKNYVISVVQDEDVLDPENSHSR
ncbi:hypothetical protein T265_04309 [Opisthorchis viverrini]|uniref:Uncharacterized protein n=1 Tax=Opisthorchis viverrini TaxID=6198 RepID=A0A074ZPH6_OPIVI|nr:hypothetical protein T265_04309 [Opisthorchis viverrini]KER29021.1 hypothetical protein T265_04309 [Opisthorchis viverrini]